MHILLKTLLREAIIDKDESIFCESTKLSISYPADISEKYKQEAEYYLRQYFKTKGREKYLNNFDWKLTKVEGTKQSRDGQDFSFTYMHKGGKNSERPLWQGSSFVKNTKTFRNSTRGMPEKDIQNDPSLVYRGMNIEEWLEAKKTGKIKSKGSYNIGSQQENWTFFTKDFRTASSYASGFAPLAYKPTRKKPAVIVAVPAKLVQNAKDVGAGPDSEYVAREIPMHEVIHAWILTPVEYEQGRFTISVVMDYAGKERYHISNSSIASPDNELIKIK